MYEFYIIFKDGNSFNGTTDHNEESFVKAIINPMRDLIYSYQFYSTISVVEENQD
jgi:hypothetical protein